MQARPERFSTPCLKGLRLHAAHWGREEAPPLVLLHGGGANLHWWDHLAPELARYFHVVALDFRGHGDSDHPEALEVGAFDRDLEALQRHLGAPEFALVGHSMGAHVALRHAATSPNVRKLVLVEPSVGATRRERRRSRLALAARRTYATRAEALARYRFVPTTPGAPERLRAAIAGHSIRREDDGRFAFKFDPRWFGLPAPEGPQLSDIRCPCLVVRGADSTLLPSAGARELVEQLPHAQLAEIPGGSHNVHLEEPAAVLEAIRIHLDEPADQPGPLPTPLEARE